MSSPSSVCTMEPRPAAPSASPDRPSSSSSPPAAPSDDDGFRDRHIDELFDIIRGGLERSERRRPAHERGRFSYRFDSLRPSKSASKRQADKMETDDGDGSQSRILFGSQLRASLLDTSYRPPGPKPAPPKPLQFAPATFSFASKGEDAARGTMSISRAHDHACEGPSNPEGSAACAPSLKSAEDVERRPLATTRGCLPDGVPAPALKTTAPERKRRITVSGSGVSAPTEPSSGGEGLAKSTSHEALFGRGSSSQAGGGAANASFQRCSSQGSSGWPTVQTEGPFQSTARQRGHPRSSMVTLGSQPSSLRSSPASSRLPSATQRQLPGNLRSSAVSMSSHGSSLRSSITSASLSSSFRGGRGFLSNSKSGFQLPTEEGRNGPSRRPTVDSEAPDETVGGGRHRRTTVDSELSGFSLTSSMTAGGLSASFLARAGAGCGAYRSGKRRMSDVSDGSNSDY